MKIVFIKIYYSIRNNLIKLIGNNMQFNFQYCNKEDLSYINGDKFKLIIKSINEK